MPASEDHVANVVDDILEAAWPSERRRALRRVALGTAARLTLAAGALWLLGFGVHLVVGTAFPWVAYGVIALLASIAAMPDSGDHSHLRRNPLRSRGTT